MSKDRDWVNLVLGVIAVVGTIAAISQVDDLLTKAIFIGFSVGLPAVIASYLFGQRNGTVRTWAKSGISAILRRGDQRPLAKILDSAGNEVLLAGPTLAQTRIQADRLLDRMKEGCRFKLLLPDPRSQRDLLLKLADFASWSGQIGPDLYASLVTFKNISRAAPPGMFEVRVHSQVPTCSILIVDNKFGNVDFYLRERGPQERLTISFRQGSLLTQAREHFNWLWQQGYALDSAAKFDEAIGAAKAIA
jgi:hypothetical protein